MKAEDLLHFPDMPCDKQALLVGTDSIDLAPCLCGGALQCLHRDGVPIAIVHVMPHCREFAHMEPNEFLRWVRQNRRTG